MDRKEMGLKNLQKCAQKMEEVKKQADQRREEEFRLREAERQETEKNRREWLRQNEIPAREAATTIWRWYKDLIVLPEFQKITTSMKKINHAWLAVSREIKVSNIAGYGSFFEGTYLFTLDIRENKLHIHRLVKYGKSKMIDTMEDLLRLVPIPILIEFAKTITDDSIWDVINFET